MVSFVDALFQRYADSTSKLSECPSCEIFIVGSLSPGKSGNHLILPPALSLNGCQIKCAGSERRIREFCRNVEELDLASNNLNDLSEVLNIVKEMPNLRFLNLSENNFSKIDVRNLEIVLIAGIKSLVLNNTKVPWLAINLLLDSMPNLMDLHLSLNNYTSMHINPKTYPNIKRLYISGNPDLTSWAEIENLVQAFPSLKGLTMADCNIDNIPDDLDLILPKPLQSLNITNWPITAWEYLERLNKLPNLVDIRCQGLKLFHSLNYETRRHHLISRMPRIQRLNGSEISKDERMHAEKAFVCWHLVNDQIPKPERFYALHATHGRVDPLADINLTPPKYAQVKIVYNENSNEGDLDSGEEKDMKVDLNKSVKHFKQQLSSILGLPASQMRVWYVDHVMIEIMGPEEMKFNQKKLYTYNVQDGDKFLVDHK